MSDELPRTGCSIRCPICPTAMIFVLTVLLAITTTGWVVTVTRERPVAGPVLTPRASPVDPAPTLPSVPLFQPIPMEPELVEVLVAAKDLPLGTMITREDLRDDKTVKT